ncbi:MAG TPA: hypothetical protein DD723_08960 [Candidatus Omnitrophica bacterium]|nr:MAG: hypothetical protein A2Z81_08560 [Omnitrophica WOR_2 bacterium GWA2_45_18]OGX19349.1 MAG: hypothetical protein A2Y04_01915 [Omnitrophica WOR_2 bacterium GWC2_45_7]HBR15646.1 hypothetical protein [Candidatus Omnitrophota bacterium]
MTITLTSKNQITLPKKIVDALRLHKGSLFNVSVKSNRIELVPLEVSEMEFTDEDYKKLDKLVKEEKRKGAKKMTRDYINNITKL